MNLASLAGTTVLYIYPMTGQPGVPLPDGWDGIPGARGCTPQSCAFRDHYMELTAHGVDHLYGLSTQTTEYQAEAAARMHLPFALLSDAQLAFDPGGRELVDLLGALMPAPGEGPGPGALVGKPAPPLVLATSDGGAIDLEDHRGKVVIIDFWATWCGPCRQALPLLHEVAEWARGYLGRISPGEEPPPVLAVEPAQRGERRIAL